MKNIPLNSLRAFALAYQAGGVRSAARDLGVSHSSISRHIKELEAWLGVALLDHVDGQRNVTFTANGQNLAESVLSHLGSIDVTLTSLPEARHSGSVVISAAASVATRWLLPRLSDLQNKLPEIEVSVLTEQQLVNPDAEHIDISLRMGKGPWPNYNCTPLMDDEFFPVIHSSLYTPNARKNPLSLFTNNALIHDRDPATTWREWFSVHSVAGINARKGPRFASSDLVVRAASQALGIGLVRGRLAADDLASGALVRPFGNHSIVIPDAYWVVTLDSSELRFEVRKVVSWMLNQVDSSCFKLIQVASS